MKPQIPGWVRKAALHLLIVEEVSARQALAQLVAVPVGWPVTDGEGGKRPALKGETRPLNEFVSHRTVDRWRMSPEVLDARRQRAEEHRAMLLRKTRKIDESCVTQLQPLTQGLRPQVDETGKLVRNAKGEQLYERIAPQVQVQAMQVAGRFAERAEGPALQRVEHSGAIDIGKLSPEELEAKREALIAKAAGRVAG